MAELETVHMVSSSPAETIDQWLNAGGMISYYDYPLDIYLDVSLPVEGIKRSLHNAVHSPARCKRFRSFKHPPR